jgi:SNF2 family DNA or RNA helicase
VEPAGSQAVIARIVSGVFAYRLIARDTVEEKILEFQRQKRHRRRIVSGTRVKGLTAEDLQLLLS